MSGYRDFFVDVASVAAEQALPFFRTALAVENKLDKGFDPVTEADRAVENAIRGLVASRFPGHGVLGEEGGGRDVDREYVWIIDPIDGTRAFISGLPVWGVLAGLTRHGDAIAGMMAQPFTGELFYGDETGAYYEGPGGPRELRTRATKEISDAILFTTTPALFRGQKANAWARLESSVKLSRYGTDCYAYAMVAAGHADIVCEPELNSYDIAGLIAPIEKAGGVVTCWDGGAAENGGDILACANDVLHRQALEILNG